MSSNMTQKKIILLAIFVLLLGGLLTAFGLGYWHKHSRLAQLRAVYEGGLHPDSSRFDIFCPEAELAYRDSLLALGQDSVKNIDAKADALMKLGEEQKAIALLTAAYPNLAASSGLSGSPDQPQPGHASSTLSGSPDQPQPGHASSNLSGFPDQPQPGHARPNIAAADPDPRKLLALAYL